MIGGPNLVILFASDLEVSKAFYEQLFGWTDSEYRPYGGYAYYVNPIPVLLMPEGAFRSGTSDLPRGWGVSLCFQVADVEGFYEHVQNLNIPIGLPLEDSGYGPTFTLIDPDGTRISIYSDGND